MEKIFKPAHLCTPCIGGDLMRYLALFISIVLLFGLVACGGSKTTEVTGNPIVEKTKVQPAAQTQESEPATKQTETNAAQVAPAGEKTECTEGQKGTETCALLYEPVCGWFSKGGNQNFANACFACMSTEVTFWTDGECPQ